MLASKNINSSDILLVAAKETSSCKTTVGSFDVFHANNAKTLHL
jgi:hypothetical protein